MAQHTILIDDIDGSHNNVSTVVFGINGKNYSIDLNPEHTRQLEEAFAYWIGHARKIKGDKKSQRPAASSEHSRAIRQWANDNGYQISERGAIPTRIKDAYAAAQHAHFSGE